MTAKMFTTTHKGKQCYAVSINGKTKFFHFSHTAASYLLNGLSK